MLLILIGVNSKNATERRCVLMYPDAMISFFYGMSAALLVFATFELISLVIIKAEKWLNSIITSGMENGYIPKIKYIWRQKSEK